MKPANRFLKSIRAWPEEARAVSAGILFFISAVGVYHTWSNNLDESLKTLNVKPTAVVETLPVVASQPLVEIPGKPLPEAPAAAGKTVGPLGSVASYANTLAEVVLYSLPTPAISDLAFPAKAVSKRTSKTASLISAAVSKSLNSLSSYIFN